LHAAHGDPVPVPPPPPVLPAEIEPPPVGGGEATVITDPVDTTGTDDADEAAIYLSLYGRRKIQD
jgi:hypothetical protein